MLDYFSLLTPVYVSIFWSLLLFSRVSPSKQFLSLFMLLASILYFGHALYFYQYFEVFTWYDSVYAFTSLSVYPMFYVYLRLLTFETKFGKKHYKHFILPAIFFSIILGSTIFMNSQERIEYFDYYIYSFSYLSESSSWLIKIKKLAYILSRIIFSIQVVFYSIMSLRVLSLHSKQIREYYSNIDEKALARVRFLVIVFSLTSVASFFINIIGKETLMQNFNMLILPSLVFSILLFMIGYTGLSQKQIVTEIQNDKKMESLSESPNDNMSDEAIINKLKDAFDFNMLHLDPDLKIWDVCLMVKVSRQRLSIALQNVYSMDFSTYVNKMRASEVQKIISKNPKISLAELVKKSGFDSQNALIREFKKHEGKNLLSGMNL